MLSQVGPITTNGVQQQTIFPSKPIIASGVHGPVRPGLVTPGLFNFDGFPRQGVGDPRIVRLAVKLVF